MGIILVNVGRFISNCCLFCWLSSVSFIVFAPKKFSKHKKIPRSELEICGNSRCSFSVSSYITSIHDMGFTINRLYLSVVHVLTVCLFIDFTLSGRYFLTDNIKFTNVSNQSMLYFYIKIYIIVV